MCWTEGPRLEAGRVADEAVRTMARTISHELNQPLTVLLGLLDLWARDDLPAPSRAALRAELREAADELAGRVAELAAAQRYATRRFGGCVLLDLVGARGC